MKQCRQRKHAALVFAAGVATLAILAAACGGSGSATPDVTVKLGEKAKTDKFEVTGNSVFTIGTFGSEYAPQKPADGAVFVVVKHTLKNISKEPQSVLLTSVKLVDSNGVSYDNASSPTMMYKLDAGIDSKALSNLNPGLTEKDATLFEVSKELWNKPGWKVIVDADKNVEVTVK